MVSLVTQSNFHQVGGTVSCRLIGKVLAIVSVSWWNLIDSWKTWFSNLRYPRYPIFQLWRVLRTCDPKRYLYIIENSRQFQIFFTIYYIVTSF